MTNSERPARARTTGGTSWSYAPPPAKHTRRSARARLASPSASMPRQHVGLGRAVGQVEPPAEAQGLRHGGEQLVERRQPEEAQHLDQLVFGVGQVIGHVYSSTRGGHSGGRTSVAASSRPRWHDGHRVAVEQLGLRLDQGQADAPFAHGRVVAAGHRADTAARDVDLGAVAQGLAPLAHHAPQPAARAVGPLLLQRGAADEVPLGPAHDPAQFGLERRDARSELVAVQRQARLEAQGVARAESGRRDAGAPRRPPRSPRPPRPARRTRPRPRRCSRCRPPGRRCPPSRSGPRAKRRTAAASGRHRGQERTGPRALHGHDGPLVRSRRRRRWPPRTRLVFEALGMTSKRSSSTHQTMMSSVTEPVASRRWVYCARPGAIFRRSLLSECCRWSKASRTVDAHGAEMADVEDHGATSGRPGARPRSPSGRPAASPTRRTAPFSPRGPHGPREGANAGTGDHVARVVLCGHRRQITRRRAPSDRARAPRAGRGRRAGTR